MKSIIRTTVTIIFPCMLIISLPQMSFAQSNCFTLKSVKVEGGTGLGKAMAGKTMSNTICPKKASNNNYEFCVEAGLEARMPAGLVKFDKEAVKRACREQFPE